MSCNATNDSLSYIKDEDGNYPGVAWSGLARPGRATLSSLRGEEGIAPLKQSPEPQSAEGGRFPGANQIHLRISHSIAFFCVCEPTRAHYLHFILMPREFQVALKI
ncbi:hypothetical protein VaNZ11_009179 [Volvox africanus]|uniref:Uncharacterized protein n=1 Tax=Volvox africanus TaxID=51714 RepID=A0ABQ5S6R8_9CHLO|nr:hypothetical protein VaNZ11_009179 [Volvox africanus]